VLRDSGLVPELQFDVAANLSFTLSFYHCISMKSHFFGNTNIFHCPYVGEPPPASWRSRWSAK
ncbi:MAG: hypothetical protein ACK55Z_20340, partial [bacterium]